MKRAVDRIIVHCSATRPGWMADAPLAAQIAEIRRWHTDPVPRGRGWSDIGYHILIGRTGEVALGRPLERTGAHTRGHNTGSIGVCLIGGHGSAATDAFAEHFTPEQDASLRSVLFNLYQEAGRPLAIHGHNEFAAKACPGFTVSDWLAQTRFGIREVA